MDDSWYCEAYASARLRTRQGNTEQYFGTLARLAETTE